MPLIFVHGVSVRKNSEYEVAVVRRNEFFRDSVLADYLGNRDCKIYNPYWGNLVPPFPKDNLIIPTLEEAKKYTALGTEPAFSSDAFPPIPQTGPVPQGQNILAAARQSLPDIVDRLWYETIKVPALRNQPEKRQEVFQAGLVLANYVESHPAPQWLNEVRDDNEFIKKLLEELEHWGIGMPSAPSPVGIQLLGFGNNLYGWMRDAADNVRDSIIDLPTTALLSNIRPGLTQRLTFFFGDTFSYLSSRGDRANPGPIVQLLLDTFREAKQQQRGEKLIVVGHSMGGNILYDVLTYFAPDLKVDALITVGCQASVFKQLSLFHSQIDGQIPGGFMPDGSNPGKAPRPPSVARWINVFDPQDILSFAFDPEFSDVDDFVFQSHVGIFTAHGEYFARVRFYERLNARLTGRA